MLRSLWNLQNQPLGMRTTSVLTATVTLGRKSYDEPARQLAFFEDLERRLHAIPGVAGFALSDSVPLSGTPRSTIYSVIDVAGRPPAAEGTGGMVTWRAVTPGYFAALGVPILRGRGFREEDRDPHQNPIILSDSLARRMFPGQDPLGRQIRPGPFRSGPWLTVVGVAGNVKNSALMVSDDPEFYVVRDHSPEPLGRTATAILSGPMDPSAMARWVRAEVAAIDPTLPVNIETLAQRAGKLAQRPRFNAWLLGLFAAMGLLLSAIGLYGVVSFVVAQRTPEIGVRMALGATPGAVVRLVLGHAARWTFAGAALGIVGSLFAARLLAAMLFHVSARDPWILAAAVAASVGDGHGGRLGALPARRAHRSHSSPPPRVVVGGRPILAAAGFQPALAAQTGHASGMLPVGPAILKFPLISGDYATCLICSAAETKSSASCSADCFFVVALSMLTYLVPSYNMGGGGSDQVVAQIGKDAITVPDVQQVVQMNMRGRQMPAELMPHYVPQFINSMVTERAMAYEAKRLGFKVSDEDLANGIRQTIPQLFQDGKFAGKDAYASVLAQQNMTIPQFEEDMARQMLVTKLRNVAMEGTVVTPQEIEQEYKHRNDKVKIQYVKIDGDKFSADCRLLPDELRKILRTNKPAYQVPEKRDLGIVIVDQAKLEQTIQPTDADLLRVYTRKQGLLPPPRARQRPAHPAEDQRQRSQADATVKAKADDLVKQLRAAKGANFAEMVKKYSEDPGSEAKGGEYDGVVRGQMVPEFDKAAFSLKVGEISDPVKTTYGYHILQVLAHDQPQLKPFDEVKAQLAVEYKKQRINDLTQQMSDKVQAALTKDPTHPDKVAADLGVQYVEAKNVGPGDPLPEVGVNKDFEDAISTLKKGEVSQPVVLTGNTKIATGRLHRRHSAASRRL